jgi:hypothetical protein
VTRPAAGPHVAFRLDAEILARVDALIPRHSTAYRQATLGERGCQVQRAKRPRLDYTDRDEVRRVVVDLRVACDDVDALVLDMLRPARARELGPRHHRDGYREAHEKIVALLTYAMPDDAPDPEPSDPAGSGSGGSPTL